MHNLQFIRENPGKFDSGLIKRGMDTLSPVILALDERIRVNKTKLQEVLARKNEVARQIPAAKKAGEDISALLQEGEEIKQQIPALEMLVEQEEAELNTMLEGLPNLLDEQVPNGDESANKVLRLEGIKPEFAFTPLEHYVLGEKMGFMDFEQTAKICGSRFVTIKGQLARMERALVNFMLDSHTKEFGYQEIVPPVLVKANAVYGVGQLPKFEEDLFKTTTDHYLISTSEVVLSNMVADLIVAEETLPMRFTAYTPCFRSEAGSAGRDTRGMIRMHQFSKVELVSITDETLSIDEHERMLSASENILKKLGLPYRVVLLAALDTGFASRKTYDLEVWLPGQNQYREIASCSNCGDFQARRMKARYKKILDGKNTFVHTLNGSGLPIGRTMIAILENYQNADGTVSIPSALQPYMDGQKLIGA